MDKVATSNRSLWDVTQLAHDECVIVGDQSCGARERVPYKDSIEGYQFLRPGLRPIELSRPESADFNSYATRWEQRYSALISDRSIAHLTFVPVVDQISFFSYTALPVFGGKTISMFPVIAHLGTVPVENIHVRRKFAIGDGLHRVKALESILDQDVVYVESGCPGEDFGSFAQPNDFGPNFFKVLTDPKAGFWPTWARSGQNGLWNP